MMFEIVMIIAIVNATTSMKMTIKFNCFDNRDM